MCQLQKMGSEWQHPSYEEYQRRSAQFSEAPAANNHRNIRHRHRPETLLLLYISVTRKPKKNYAFNDLTHKSTLQLKA